MSEQIAIVSMGVMAVTSVGHLSAIRAQPVIQPVRGIRIEVFVGQGSSCTDRGQDCTSRMSGTMISSGEAVSIGVIEAVWSVGRHGRRCAVTWSGAKA